MFKLSEAFKECNEKRQSHSFIIEYSSDLEHMHGHTGDDGYYFDCPGNRYILRTPKLHDFSLALSVRYTMLTNRNTDVRIHFGYDRRTRTGYALELEWRLTGTIILRVLSIDNIHATCIRTLEAGKVDLCEDTWYEIAINVSGKSLKGSVGGLMFALEIPEFERGFVALQRGSFIGEWILREMILESPDEFEEVVLVDEQTAVIPMLFGGSNPYELKYSISSIDGQKYLNINLDGGTYRQRSNFPGQYAVAQDYFTGLYIRAGSNKWNICGNELSIVNPQVAWECLKKFFNTTELPIVRSWQIDNDDITDVAIGFAKATQKGYHIQSGGPWEFAYDLSGKLIYSGQPAGNDWFELKSPADKTAVKIIPLETVQYETVAAHFRDNHYFAPDEPMKLKLVIHTDKKYITVKARFCDVYGNKLFDVELDDDYSCTIAPKDIGLYRIVYDVYYGERLLASPDYVLEVFDPTGKKCAPLESGLPFLYSTPNEQKMLDRDPFDPWNPRPSCNAEHFFCCVCFTPVYARERRTWEITKLFGREWYVWLSNRVMPGNEKTRPDLPKEP
nr:hypothetical protein [Clostridia bacterium]